MFWATFERVITSMALNNMPLVMLLIIIVVVLAVTVAIRYNKKITQAQEDREMRALMVKQQGKIIRLLGALPAISKRNATWLADPKQNDQIPDQPVCSYSDAIEKGDV